MQSLDINHRRLDSTVVCFGGNVDKEFLSDRTISVEESDMVKITKGRVTPIQNIGLLDRTMRCFGGGALLAWGSWDIAQAGSNLFAALSIILSVYPVITSLVGWDPFYQLVGGRTCSLEGGRNQCGTLPYEVDAALGHDPRPSEGYEYDHSLAGAHHY